MPGPVDTSLTMQMLTDLAALAQQPGLTLIELTAAWGPPCRAPGPALEASVAEDRVRVVVVDVDPEVALAARGLVRAVPAVVLWGDGGDVGGFVGLLSGL